MQTELEQKQEEASEARKQYEEHQKDTNRVKDNIKKAEEDHNSKIAPVEKVKSDIEQAENVLRSLTKDRGTQDAGFDPKLPMLLRAIRNDNSFSKQPVGPIGHHVRLLKPKWSSILETSFGATLTSFVVTSKRDMNILSNIMKRVKWYVHLLFPSTKLPSHESPVNFPYSSEVKVISTPQNMNRMRSSIRLLGFLKYAVHDVHMVSGPTDISTRSTTTWSADS